MIIEGENVPPGAPPEGDPKPTLPKEDDPPREPPREEPPIPAPPAQEPPPGADVPPKIEAAADEQELAEAVQTEFALLKEAARFATSERIRNVVEALLFAASEPVAEEVLTERLGDDTDVVGLLCELAESSEP